MTKPRLLVVCSGGGRTLENLIDRIRDGRLDAEIAGVAVSSTTAYAAERAKSAGHSLLSFAPYPIAEASRAVFDFGRQAGAHLVVLAGYMHLIQIPDDFRDRVINIHPSLIPAFSGKGWFGNRIHQGVLDRGVKVTGCTVHFADNEFDSGPIILQRTTPVLDNDDAESLALRVFEAECEALPEAISLYGAGRLRLKGRLVQIVEAGAGEGG